MTAAFSALWAWVVIQTPRVAVACSVCSAGRDEENQTAFLLSTLFMSLLPLIAIGSIVFFLWRRIRSFEEARDAKNAAVSRGVPTAH